MSRPLLELARPARPGRQSRQDDAGRGDHLWRHSGWLSIVCVALLVIACSSDDRTQVRAGDSPPPESAPPALDGSGAEANPEASPWYAVTTNVPTGAGYSGYLVGTTTLERRSLDRVDSTEIRHVEEPRPGIRIRHLDEGVPSTMARSDATWPTAIPGIGVYGESLPRASRGE